MNRQKRVRRQITMTDELWEAVAQRAAPQGISKSLMISLLVRKALEAEKQTS